MSRYETCGELSRRQFVGYSGMVGAAAALAGTGLGPHGCRGDNMLPDLCGKRSDSGPRLYLWDSTRACVANPHLGNCLVTETDYVVLPGRPENKHNFLLVPTQRIKGIECPKLWTTYASINYWEDAWYQAHKPGGTAEVSYVVMNVNYVGLGVNSARARQQDQLHIHMAGFSPGESKYINEQHAKITDTPGKWPDSIIEAGGILYRALHLKTLAQNPFVLLHDYVVVPTGGDMAEQTLLVTSSDSGGVYLLNSEGGLKSPAHPGLHGTGTCDLLLVYS
jgi:CDP-diacylglycerol pyrophosphatase